MTLNEKLISLEEKYNAALLQVEKSKEVCETAFKMCRSLDIESFDLDELIAAQRYKGDIRGFGYEGPLVEVDPSRPIFFVKAKEEKDLPLDSKMPEKAKGKQVLIESDIESDIDLFIEKFVEPSSSKYCPPPRDLIDLLSLISITNLLRI